MTAQPDQEPDPFEGTSAKTELQRAYLLLEYEEWDHALAACERAAERAPAHPMPDALKGSILAARGDFTDAIRTLRRASRAHPDHALTQIFLAESLLLDGKLPAGRKALQAARECPDFEEYREMANLLSSALLESIGEKNA